MPTELEAKLRVTDHAPIREKLKTLGATGGEVTRETNTFFDTHDATLRSQDKGLRLRENRRDSGTTYVVTYKGPKTAGAFKSREEIEFTVDEPAAFTRTLEALGYHRALAFAKVRETWHLRNCTVELDTLPTLPSPNTFLEVEGPDEVSIRGALELLGLSREPLVKESYSKLISQSGRK